MKTLIIRDSNQQISVTNIKDAICDDAKAMRTQTLIILAGYLSHTKNPIGDDISNNLSMAQNIPHFFKDDLEAIEDDVEAVQDFKAQIYEKYIAQAEKLIPTDIEYYIADNIVTPQKEFDRDAWRFDGEKIVTDPQKQIEIIRTRRNALLDDLDMDEAKAQFRGADILQSVQDKKQTLRDFPQVVENSGLTDPNAIREFTIEAYKQLFS